MRMIMMILCLLVLTGCASQPVPETVSTIPSEVTTLPTEENVPTPPPETEPPDPIQRILEGLSIEERVGQLFLARCDQSVAMEDLQAYHLGGFVLFGEDFQSETPNSLKEKLSAYQVAARLPLLLAVDEEGGSVNRVSRYPAYRSQPFSSPRTLYAGGGLDWVLTTEEEKCTLLKSLGLNVNLGPVCDISTDRSAFMYHRSLGLDPHTTADVIFQMVKTMHTYQIGSALKHFPGYGNNADTHTGIAVDSRSLDQLVTNDLIPFSAGIDAGCGAILVSHTIVEAMDPELPASLSPAVHQYLREEMGFEGVILTDDLVMQAITDVYGAGDAAVLAVLAGNDLLCSTEYRLQYEAVLAAVFEGRIPYDMLNAAVRNVLQWKISLGLL